MIRNFHWRGYFLDPMPICIRKLKFGEFWKILAKLLIYTFFNFFFHPWFPHAQSRQGFSKGGEKNLFFRFDQSLWVKNANMSKKMHGFLTSQKNSQNASK